MYITLFWDWAGVNTVRCE